MALIKTIQEVKDVLPKLVAKLSSNSMLPNMDRAEQKYLIPLIGNELYNDLQTKYDAVALSATEITLLKHARLITASYGFLDELPTLHVTLTNEGLRSINTSDMPKAVGWEYKDFKSFLLSSALDGVEVLLNYLWANKGSFELWTNSNAYNQFSSLLIRTGTEFNTYYTLYHPMRTFYAFKPVLKDVQDDYLVEGFGEDLINYFVTADLSNEEQSIASLLKKALAYLTIFKAGHKYPVRISDTGFTIASKGDPESTEDAGRTEPSLSLLQLQLKASEQEGIKCLNKAKKKLAVVRTTGSSEAFNTAFDAGPLVSYIDTQIRDSGNSRRKIFRM